MLHNRQAALIAVGCWLLVTPVPHLRHTCATPCAKGAQPLRNPCAAPCATPAQPLRHPCASLCASRCATPVFFVRTPLCRAYR